MIWLREENPKLLFCGGHPKQSMSALQITSLFDYMLLSFCTQLKNLSREANVSERERVLLPWYQREWRVKGKLHFGSAHTVIRFSILAPFYLTFVSLVRFFNCMKNDVTTQLCSLSVFLKIPKPQFSFTLVKCKISALDSAFWTQLGPRL